KDARRIGYEIEHSRASLWIAGGRHMPSGLVQQQVHARTVDDDRHTVERDVIVRGIDAAFQRRDLAVDRDATGSDQLVPDPSRPDAGARQQLLQPFAGRHTSLMKSTAAVSASSAFSATTSSARGNRSPRSSDSTIDASGTKSANAGSS